MNFVLVLVFGDKDALSIVPNSAGSTWRQNPIIETLCVLNKNRTMGNFQKHSNCTRCSLCRLIRLLSMWCRASAFLSASGTALSQEVPTDFWVHGARQWHFSRQVVHLFCRKFQWQNECPISLHSQHPILRSKIVLKKYGVCTGYYNRSMGPHRINWQVI
jgi:hypothetical protein